MSGITAPPFSALSSIVHSSMHPPLCLSIAIIIVLPLTALLDTFRIPSALHTLRALRLANTSIANALLTSVDVVITGCALQSVSVSRAAILEASSLAPPRCPASTGITYLPASSITMTGLSAILFVTNGAIVRTAIPAAPMIITGSPFVNASESHSCIVRPSRALIASLPGTIRPP